MAARSPRQGSPVAGPRLTRSGRRLARTLAAGGRRHQLRVEVCDRRTSGQARHRTVVFAGWHPLAEAVGVDDSPRSRSLAGLLKDADGRMIRPGDPVPGVDNGFPIVDFSSEVTGPLTRTVLAVLLREDDYVPWAAFALPRAAVGVHRRLRHHQFQRPPVLHLPHSAN